MEALPDSVAGIGGDVPAKLVQRHFRHRVLGEVTNKLIWIAWRAGMPEGLRLSQGKEFALSLTLLVAEADL